MTRSLAQWLVRYRLMLSFLSVLVVVLSATGVKHLYFQSDYQVFFAEENPQLLAHEHIQDTYTKSDNMLFLIDAGEGGVFRREVLESIAWLTEEAWNTPYSVRVDSLTNYQHSEAQGDTLEVADLVREPESLDEADLQRVRDIALNEPQLLHNLISENGRVTAVNVSLELPEAADTDSPHAERKAQSLKRDSAFAEILAFSRDLEAQLNARHPEFVTHLLGVPVVSETFKEQAEIDSRTLIPGMYLIIVVLLSLFLRSLGSVVSVVVLIAFSTLAALGALGWSTTPLNQVSAIAPIIITTIAVCDCVHLLVIYLRHLSLGQDRFEAMVESLTVNIQPIVLTSVTTAIGFVSLVFSESPPFQQLGLLCAYGVMLAMVLTLTLLPAICIALIRRRRGRGMGDSRESLSGLANWVIARPGKVALSTIVVALILMAQMPRNQLNDDTIAYFQPGVALRDAADYYNAHLSGFDRLVYSLDCGEPGCVNDPEFLARVKALGDWFMAQDKVVFIDTYIDVIEKLNRNMHGGDPEWQQLPESQNMAAQYQLLYEMSLPYGLDLNTQVNFDKSALRILLHIHDALPQDLIALDKKAWQWFEDNAPELQTHGASIPMMFAHIGMKNIESMMTGSAVALIGITLTLLVALRSFRFGLLSLFPNAFPAGMALGLWGLLWGQVNLAVAVVFSVTLGIVVDDTVHFMSKYLRARREHGDSPEDAVRYAFATVGSALVVTTVVLSLGFGILMFSNVNINAYMGAMTAITIALAVIFDFLFLPAALLLVERWRGGAPGA